MTTTVYAPELANSSHACAEWFCPPYQGDVDPPELATELAVQLQQHFLDHAPHLAQLACKGLRVDDLWGGGAKQGKARLEMPTASLHQWSPSAEPLAYLGGHRGLHTAQLLDGPVQVLPAAGDYAQEQLHLVLQGSRAGEGDAQVLDAQGSEKTHPLHSSPQQTHELCANLHYPSEPLSSPHYPKRFG